MRISLLVTMLVATAAHAADPRALLTEAKLAVDSGRPAEAAALFERVAADDSAPLEIRCEAYVRQAAAWAASGLQPKANLLYKTIPESNCGKDVEAMRLLVEAVTGVQQDPATWRGRTDPVRIGIADGRAVAWFGDDPMPTVQTPPAGTATVPSPGEPITINAKDAKVADLMALFGQFTGVPFRVEPAEAGERTVTLQVVDVPWEQVLAVVLGSTGLRSEQDAEGVRIFPNTFTKLTGDEALLNTVRIAFEAYRRDNAAHPVAESWTPVAELAPLVEPAYVRTLPRMTPAGKAIEYRSVDGTESEVRVRPGDQPEVPIEPNGNTEFTGEPISMSMKDAELADVFRLFREFTGLNIAVAQSVSKKKITVEMERVPWDQALALILNANGLEADFTGNVLFIRERWSLRGDALPRSLREALREATQPPTASSPR